jgi:hypothetical protein
MEKDEISPVITALRAVERSSAPILLSDSDYRLFAQMMACDVGQTSKAIQEAAEFRVGRMEAGRYHWD